MKNLSVSFSSQSLKSAEKKVRIHFESKSHSLILWEGILYMRFTPGLILHLDLAEQVYKEAEDLTEGEPSLLLTDLSKISYWTLGAQSFLYYGTKKKLIRACAMLVPEGHAGTVWKEFFTRFINPAYSFKFCQNEKEAVSWLNKCR